MTPSPVTTVATTPGEQPGQQRYAPAWLPVALVAVASLAVYANALVNGLHVDDQYQIVTNPWITSFRNLPTIFSSGVWDFDGRISSYYRPMMYVWYSLAYAVAGTSPWAYHLLNLLLHAGTATLALLLARELLEPGVSSRPWWRSPAFVTGLLFAVHPIHTEPVAWAAGIVDLSCAFFCLLAFYLAVRGNDRYGYVVGALAAYTVALLSKEPAITLPVVLIVYWWLKQPGELGIKAIVIRLVPWVAVSAGYLLVRSVVLGGLAPQTSAVTLTNSEYVLSALALLGRFLTAEVLPLELNFWHVFTPVRTLWSADAWLAVLKVGTWAALLVWAIRRRALVPCVALTLAVLPLTPALLLRSLNQGVENAFAERYVYLSSFGVLLLAGWAVAELESRRARLARPLAAALAVLVVVGAAATVVRNPVWKDSLSLWKDAAAKSPQSGVANLNYGLALLSAGDTESGKRYVARGVSLAPALVRRDMDRAIAYARSGRSKEAILAFHKVLVMAPRSAEAHYNLGVLYEEMRDSQRAANEYEAAIALDGADANSHNNLGILYFTAGDRDQGMKHLEEAVRLRPDDGAFRANLERARAH